MMDFHLGQRWISESEPELGLGSIERVSDRRVTVVFKASGETREYSRASAPLRRVRFREGDTIRNHQDQSFTIDSVAERHGLISYGSGRHEIPETDLNDATGFNRPEERIAAGHVDPPGVFDLRLAALGHQHLQRKSRIEDRCMMWWEPSTAMSHKTLCKPGWIQARGPGLLEVGRADVSLIRDVADTDLARLSTRDLSILGLEWIVAMAEKERR